MFRSRRRGRRNFGRFAAKVRKAQGQTLVKRILLDQLTVPDITTVDFDNPLTVNLLSCLEAQDEELISDGTNVATAPLYSKVTSINCAMTMHGVAAQTVFRWLLYKEPDGEALITSLASASFHGYSDSPTGRESRKMTLAKGFVRFQPRV